MVEELTAKDFGLTLCQAVLFTPEAAISAKRLLPILLPKWGERFDAEPVALPSVPDAPVETPRLIFQDSLHEWRCLIAPTRIDITWNKATPKSSAPGLGDFFSSSVALLNDYREIANPRIGRIAAVIARHAPTSQPGLFLARHFCHKHLLSNALKRPESFELHARKTYTLAGKFRVNSWIRNKTGIIPVENQQPIVLVEQDLNTLAEDTEERAFSAVESSEFFAAVSSEFDNILELYYPSAS